VGVARSPSCFFSSPARISCQNTYYEIKRLYDAARCVATVFDELNRLIENSLLARKEKPPIKD